MPWLNPNSSKIWVASGAIYVRYHAITKQTIAEVWACVDKEENINESIGWIYQARGIGNNSLNGWKNSTSKNEALKIVDEWLLKDGWKFLDSKNPLLSIT
jgi:hypothetical protein